MCRPLFASLFFFFFFNDTATTEIYTLSLHDALPIDTPRVDPDEPDSSGHEPRRGVAAQPRVAQLVPRSEEHTSELQSHVNLVCRLLLEKKKTTQIKLFLLNKQKIITK